MGRQTKNLGEAIRRKLATNADLAEQVSRDRFSINVSEEVFRIRTECGLTQTELADRMGTQQSVIARLEDADYDGHSLKLLNRVAEATGTRLEVKFVGCIPMEHPIEFFEIPSSPVAWSDWVEGWLPGTIDQESRQVFFDAKPQRYMRMELMDLISDRHSLAAIEDTKTLQANG